MYLLLQLQFVYISTTCLRQLQLLLTRFTRKPELIILALNQKLKSYAVKQKFKVRKQKKMSAHYKMCYINKESIDQTGQLTALFEEIETVMSWYSKR